MDFFTVPTITGRVLFVVIVLSHVRRRIVHVNVTEHPTAAWTAQQVVDAFPDDTAPKWLHRDRDSVYSETFRRRVASLGIVEVVSAPASPWQNPYAERVIGSIRRECLDHVIVLNQAHLRRVLTPKFERTSRSTRTRRSPEASCRRPTATSWQFLKSAVCITVTNGAPRSTPRSPSGFTGVNSLHKHPSCDRLTAVRRYSR
jgi:transposase InsO family protein